METTKLITFGFIPWIQQNYPWNYWISEKPATINFCNAGYALEALLVTLCGKSLYLKRFFLCSHPKEPKSCTSAMSETVYGINTNTVDDLPEWADEHLLHYLRKMKRNFLRKISKIIFYLFGCLNYLFYWQLLLLNIS